MKRTLFALCLAFSTAQAQTPADPYSYSREVRFERDPVTGWITAEVQQPNHPQLCLRTTYSYDTYGNRRVTSQSHCAGATGSAVISTRTTTEEHTAEGTTPAGLVPTVITNAQGHVERRQVDARWGSLTRLQQSNGLVTTVTLDEFGRKVLEVFPDGNRQASAYLYCTSVGGSQTCPTAAGAILAWLARTTPQNASGVNNGPVVTTYYDTEGREVRQETDVFGNGAMNKRIVVKQYDTLGRIIKESEPYFEGETVIWVERQYDELNRVVQERRPNPNASGGFAVSQTQYNGRFTLQTNALNQTLTKERDDQDRVMRVTDTQGNQISYQHDAFGNLSVVRDPLGNTTTLSYDLRGRKVGMSDPNMGVWSYEVDVLGQLVKQTSPKAHVTTFTYDNLGRMTRRLEADLDSRWYFDLTAAGTACGPSVALSRGQLCESTTTTGYRRLNTYDTLARLVRSTTTLASGSNGTFVSKISYDTNSRISQQIWPTGLGINYLYNAQGVLVEMRDASSASTVYWQRLENNARGQFVRTLMAPGLITATQYQAETGLVSQIRAGNSTQTSYIVQQNYTYNALNNLVSRNDANTGWNETFEYDNLNRLIRQRLSNSSANLNRDVSYIYNALGNLLFHSDVGGYDYTPPAGSSGPTRPHAVKRVTGQAGKLTHPTYTYDAHGNLQSVVGNNGITRTHTWTSFDLPQSLALSERNVSTVFHYGPEHQRVRQTITRDGQSRVIHYLHPDNEGGLYYEREEQGLGGVATNRHYLTADKGVFLQLESPGSVQAEPVVTALTGLQQRHWHKDHLGSISAITDSTGAVLERLGYEPFGKRRQASGQADPTGQIDGQRSRRGFTGHEHLDEVDYLHLNARLYDPDLGRFLSPDPTVPYLHHLQSFNRYSYTRNNPLNFIDPTGFTDINASSHSDADQGIQRAPAHSSADQPTGNKMAEGTQKSATENKTAKSAKGTAGYQGPSIELPDCCFKASAAAAKPSASTWGSFLNLVETLDREVLTPLGPMNPTLPLKGAAVLFGTIKTAKGVSQAAVEVKAVSQAAQLVTNEVKAARGASAYSVAFETAIPKLGLGTRPEHFKAANSALESAIKSDPSFARMAKNLGVAIPTNRGTSPTDWTWHHVPDRAGILQLVPRNQHSWGSPQQPLLHPGGKGGFSNWGMDY